MDDNEEKLIEYAEHGDTYAYAWFVFYTGDTYGMGPYRFRTLSSAEDAAERAYTQFGAYPSQIWPDGETEKGAPYTFTVLDYPSNRE